MAGAMLVPCSCEPGFYYYMEGFMECISFYIDGFNLYHSIKYNKNHHKYRWLNLKKMCQSFIKKNEKIIDIFYFTAYATWRPPSMERHKIYVKALQLFNIIPIFGKFKIKDRFCPNCKKNTFHMKKNKPT